MVTYNIGTGLVIARRDDGSWSPPSAISSFGMGWGAQVNCLDFNKALIPAINIFLLQCLLFSLLRGLFAYRLEEN